MAITGKTPDNWNQATKDAIVTALGEEISNVNASKASTLSANKVETYEMTPEAFMALAITESAELTVTPDVILEIKVGSKTYILDRKSVV